MSQKAILFGNYYWGMGKDAVIALCQAKPCEDAPESDLLLCNPEPVRYAQCSWHQVFTFNRDGELSQITLEHPAQNVGQYLEIQTSLQKEDLKPVYIETEMDAYDLLSVANGADLSQIERDARDFEKNAIQTEHWASIYFFPANLLRQALADKKINSYSSAVDAAPENFCQICLMVNEDYLKLNFSAPLLNRKSVLKYGQMIRRK